MASTWTPSHTRRINGLIDAIGAVRTFTIRNVATKNAGLVRIVKQSGILPDEQIEEFANFLPRYEAQSAEEVASAMLAAALILCHCHVDDLLNRLIGICIQSDWDAWKDRVLQSSKRRYTLEEALTLDPSSATVQAMRNYLVVAARKSIMDRNEMVLGEIGHFGKSATASRTKSKDIKELDDRRHALIHANAVVKERMPDETTKLIARAMDHAENLIQSAAEKFAPALDLMLIPDPDDSHDICTE